MSNIPIYLVSVIVLLGVLIVIHEWGHFIVARLCGVRVLRFSVGFGPVIWSRRQGVDQTEYSLSLIPLGGYVRMLDEREGEVTPEELHRSFNRQSLGKRTAIVAAGPVANFLLAILIYWGLFWHGTQEYLPVLGTPAAETPAAAAGIRNGERVLRVDGTPVATQEEFVWVLLERAAKSSQVQLEILDEQEQPVTRELDVSAIPAQGWEGDFLATLGLQFYTPPPIIGKVIEGGPAEKAQILPGDRILSINGAPIQSWRQISEEINRASGKTVNIRLERGNQDFDTIVTPKAVIRADKTFHLINVGPLDFNDESFRPRLRGQVGYGFLDAGIRAIQQTWSKSAFSVVMFGKMLTGEISWRNLSGPITIAEYAGKSAQHGIDDYLKFMAFISLSLGIMNLLPIPVLDGGHLMYYGLEWIKGAPLSERTMALGQRFGLFLLFTLIGFALFNDLSRTLGRLFV